VLQVQGVGSFAQRYHVDQPRTQIKRKGNSGVMSALHSCSGALLGIAPGIGCAAYGARDLLCAACYTHVTPGRV
jgi:hypothetical protein